MGEWQAYIDNSLIGSGQMHSAAICGMDGSYWAYGGTHLPQPEEVAHIVAAVKDPTLAQSKGIVIAGQKYFTLRAQPGLIYCKLGATGACIAQTEQAVVLGVYGEGINAAHCNMTVESVANYLKQNHY